MTDNKTVAMTMRIPESLYEAIRREAFTTKRKQIDIVREALERYFNGATLQSEKADGSAETPEN